MTETERISFLVFEQRNFSALGIPDKTGHSPPLFRSKVIGGDHVFHFFPMKISPLGISYGRLEGYNFSDDLFIFHYIFPVGRRRDLFHAIPPNTYFLFLGI
jgi:hypothetical protein